MRASIRIRRDIQLFPGEILFSAAGNYFHITEVSSKTSREGEVTFLNTDDTEINFVELGPYKRITEDAGLTLDDKDLIVELFGDGTVHMMKRPQFNGWTKWIYPEEIDLSEAIKKGDSKDVLAIIACLCYGHRIVSADDLEQGRWDVLRKDIGGQHSDALKMAERLVQFGENIEGLLTDVAIWIDKYNQIYYEFPKTLTIEVRHSLRREVTRKKGKR